MVVYSKGNDVSYSNRMFEIAAEVLIADVGNSDSGNLQEFEELVIALSADSGLPTDEVQALLVAKMLRDGKHYIPDKNVIWQEKLGSLLRFP
jgi:hypothetical protein